MGIIAEAIGAFGNWRDQLIPASWRGVPFYMEQSEARFGRKVKVITPWGLDGAYFEDQGEAPDEFMVVGYILANASNRQNYLKQKDELIAALKDGHSGTQSFIQKGKTYNKFTAKYGTLKHPYYGEVDAVLKEPALITETSKEGGICRFEATFTRWNQDTAPAISFTSKLGDVIGAVDAVALPALFAAVDTFSAVMNLSGAFINTLGGIIKGCLGAVQGAINAVQGGVASLLSSSFSLVSSTIGTVDDALSSPCRIGSVIGTGVDGLLSCVGMAGNIVTSGVVGACSGELRGSIFEMSGKEIPENLALSVVRAYIQAQSVTESDFGYVPSSQVENSALVVDLYKSLCLINAAKVAIRGDYASQEKAKVSRDLVSNYLDALLLRLGERDIDNSLMAQSMESLLSTFVLAMDEKILGLKQETDYDVPVDGVPALVLAYDRYEDVERESEILAMNRVPAMNPCFMPAGDTIVVLDS